jgi:hypothetical protein
VQDKDRFILVVNTVETVRALWFSVHSHAQGDGDICLSATLLSQPLFGSVSASVSPPSSASASDAVQSDAAADVFDFEALPEVKQPSALLKPTKAPSLADAPTAFSSEQWVLEPRCAHSAVGPEAFAPLRLPPAVLQPASASSGLEDRPAAVLEGALERKLHPQLELRSGVQVNRPLLGFAQPCGP